MSVSTREIHNPTRSYSKAQRPYEITRPSDEPQDIKDYYNISNELDFLTKYGARMKEEEKFFYLVENQLKFLGEFVGKIPVTKVTYLLNDRNGLNFAGIRATDMLRTTSEIAGSGSREILENEGLKKIFQAYEDDQLSGSHQLKNAAVLSPPSNWNYGFVFFYDKKYDPFLEEYVVNMYPLRYLESRNQTACSKRIVAQLDPNHQGRYQTTNDFLINPFIGNVPELSQMLNTVGIYEQDLQDSKRFERIIEEELGEAIGFYAQSLIALHNTRQQMSSFEKEEKMIFLEKLRRGIFNKAKDIWETKDKIFEIKEKFEPSSSHPTTDRTVGSPQAGFDAMAILAYADRSPATVVGGGSCPVAGLNVGSSSALADKLSKGLSIETTISSLLSSKDKSSCSTCGKPDDGHYHCPGCSKPYASEIDVPSSQRTKICGCGFEFHC